MARIFSGKVEQRYQTWKNRYAPNGDEKQFDYRGAFEHGIQPDELGHLPEQFMTKDHPNYGKPDDHSEPTGDFLTPGERSSGKMFNSGRPLSQAEIRSGRAEAPSTGVNGARVAASGGFSPDGVLPDRALPGGAVAPAAAVVNGRQVYNPAGAAKAVAAAPMTPLQQAAALGTGRSVPATAAQTADKAAFDSRFNAGGQYDPNKSGRLPYPTTAPAPAALVANKGFDPNAAAAKLTPNPLAIAPLAVTAPTAAAPTAPAPGAGSTPLLTPGGLPAIDTSQTVAGAKAQPTFGGQPLNADPASPGPALAVDPSAAQVAGAQAKRFLRSAVSEVGNILPTAPATNRVGFRGEGMMVDPGMPKGPDALVTGVKDFASGVAGSSAAGVSNSDAAQFQKPAADSTAPVTPSTPVKNPDDSDNAISNFGLSEDDAAKKRTQYAGF